SKPKISPFSLARQGSIYSLTFDEFQSALGGAGKDFGSMNMDELLRNIWTAEESNAIAATLTPATTAAPASNGHPAPGLHDAAPHAQPDDGGRGLARHHGLLRRGAAGGPRAGAGAGAGSGAGGGPGAAAADPGADDAGGVPGARRRGAGGHGGPDRRGAGAGAGSVPPGQCGRADHAGGERGGARSRRAGAWRADDGGGADHARRAERVREDGGRGSLVAVAGAVSLRHRDEGEEGAYRREGGREAAEAHDQEPGVRRQVPPEEAGSIYADRHSSWPS
uniref:Uncharacterized protein n=1 Tax=Aegilops tauschii subsp. strangulata TaxID=200361 RepID=A0A453R396_AEGTS